MDIATILTRKYPDTLWALNGNDYANLDWRDETPKPSLADLEAEWAQVEYEAQYEAVQKQRQAAYQAGSDPIFFDYQRGEATEQDWLDEVEAIKTAYPYPVDPSTIVEEPVDEPTPEEV